MWAPILENLSKNYYLLIFDNRGIGRTTDISQPFTVDTMADDVIELIDALSIHCPTVVGHSLGGAITQVIAQKYPNKVKKIILCNTFMKLNANATRGFSHVLDLYRQKATPAQIMENILPWGFSPSFITTEFLQTLQQTSNDNPYFQTLNGYERQWNALLQFDSTKWVRDISVPTLIIGSRNDITATIAETSKLHTHIKRSELLILPGAHASMFECPKLLSRAIKNYCR